MPKSVADRVREALQPVADLLTETHEEVPCVAVLVPWGDQYPAGFVFSGERPRDQTVLLTSLLHQLVRMTGAIAATLEKQVNEQVKANPAFPPGAEADPPDTNDPG